MAGQNGLLFSKVPRHRSAVYLRIEQSSQLKQEFFIIFQCPLDGEQFTAGGVLLSVFPKMDRAVGQTVEGPAGGGDQIFQYAGLGEDRGGFEAHREDWCLLL